MNNFNLLHRKIFKVVSKVIIVFGFLLLILLFQNCGKGFNLDSQVSFSSLEGLQRENSGNGSGYEGKPDEIYNRYTPNFYCEAKPSPIEYLKIQDDVISIFSNRFNKCNRLIDQSSKKDLKYSPFQSEFVVIKNSLFTKQFGKANEIPTQLAEALCRDDFQNPSIEIITHYDYSKKLALARIYSTPKNLIEFETSRLISIDQVTYGSSNLKFKIDFTTKDENGMFKGEIENSLAIKDTSSKNLTCVIGGSLDVSLWNLQKISDYQTSVFFTNKTTGDLFFVNSIGSTNFHLYQQTVEQSFSFLRDGVKNLFNDLNKTVFGEDKIVVPFMMGSLTDDIQMMHLNHVDKSISSKEGYQTLHLFNSKNFSYISRNDFPFKGDFQFDSQGFLYLNIVNNVIDSCCKVNTELMAFDAKFQYLKTIFSTNEYFNFKLLKEKNKLLISPSIFFEDANNRLIIYDINTGESKNLNVKLASNEKCLMRATFFEPLENETKVLVYAECNSVTKIFMIDLESGIGTQISNGGEFVSWISSNRKYFMLDKIDKPDLRLTDFWNFASANTKKLFNSADLTYDPINADTCLYNFHSYQIRIPPTTNLFEPLNCSWKMEILNNKLFAISGDSGNSFPIRLDLETKVSEKICTNIKEKFRYFINPKDGKSIYALTYDEKLKIYHVYDINVDSNECSLINQFQSENPYGSPYGIKSTEVGFSIYFPIPNTKLSELLFIPVDGRPPIKVNGKQDGSYSIDVIPKLNRLYFVSKEIDKEKTISTPSTSSFLYMIDLSH